MGGVLWQKEFLAEPRHSVLLVMDLFMPARYWVNQRVLRQVARLRAW